MRTFPNSLIMTVDGLREAGWTDAARRRALASGEHVRIRDGVIARRAAWTALTLEQRIVERARALALVSTVEPVFTHTTSVAIHGGPLVRVDERLHVLCDDSRSGAVRGVSRRRSGPTSPEVITIDGLRCTSLDATMTEVARWERPETAVAVLDATLARIAAGPRQGEIDHAAAEVARDRWLSLASVRPYRLGAAMRPIRFAEPAAQRPGESVSRLYLRRLGFAPPRLQVPVPSPTGGRYFLDFGLDDADAFGEFDGVGKYTDPALTRGRPIDQIVLDEKQREDWIRGTTQRRFGRWGWPHIPDHQTLGRRLEAFSIRPGRPLVVAFSR